MSERSGIFIAGIGNRYRTDDAVGLRLVEEWQSSGSAFGGAELWEDFDGAAVAHRLLELARPVLLVDCAEMGLPGGAFRVLSVREIEKMPGGNVVSTHGIGLAEGIRLAGALGHGQPLWVFGVQPFDISMGGELSSAMDNILPEVRQGLAAAITELARQLVAG